jgi:hypothetical protein
LRITVSAGRVGRSTTVLTRKRWPSAVTAQSVGEIVDSIQLPDGSPFPHGMSVWKGYIYWTDDIGGGMAPVCRVRI